MTMILPQKWFWSASKVFSFNMTAVDGGSLEGTGYRNDGSSNYGSIDKEPLSGKTLLGIYDRGSDFFFRFDSDVSTTLDGYTEIYIDGVLAYSGGVFNSEYFIGGSRPSSYGFQDGQTYFIQIKEP